MIKFKQKSFNEIFDGAWKGGVLGAGAGTALGAGGLTLGDLETGKLIKFQNKSYRDKPWAVTVGGVLVGAALGALVGTIKEINKVVNRKGTDSRLMADVLKGLEKYKEGKDYTRDPKTANNLQTKVCIAFTKNAADFKVLVNVAKDGKLKALSERIINKLPKNIKSSRHQASDKFNEIEIATVSDASSNVSLITGLVVDFIQGGYPVYIVEVG